MGLGVERRPAEGDDQREIIGMAPLLQVGEQRKIGDAGIAVEPRAELRQPVRQHVIERAQAIDRVVDVEILEILDLDARLVRPVDGHAVEQRMQDAEAHMHAVERHARLDQAPHGGLHQMRHRLVAEARGDDGAEVEERRGDYGAGHAALIAGGPRPFHGWFLFGAPLLRAT